MNNFYNNLNWVTWEKATFVVFLFSTSFMVLFSVDAVDHWPFPWNQISITAACLTPIFMIVIQYWPDWVSALNIKKEFVFIAALIILGVLNIFFSKNHGFYFPNFKGMVLFLLPAIGAFMASFFIFNSVAKINYVFWFYGGMLLWVCLYGLWQYKTVGFVAQACPGCDLGHVYSALFTSNPISAGATLLCLFAGPVLLFISSYSQAEKICLSVALFLGVVVIILLQQRAAMLSVLFMVFFFGVFSSNRRYTYPALSLVAIFALGYLFLEFLPPFIQEKINALIKFPIFRLEMYPFALHIFKEFPLLGIGVWTSLEEFLLDYTPTFLSLPKEISDFKYLLYTKTSFHNMILYLFVHMGGLFAIAYILFIVSILGDLIKRCVQLFAGKKIIIFYFTWLIGLLIPVLNVDLLMYPDINFLFHSMLGLAPNLHLLALSQTQ